MTSTSTHKIWRYEHLQGSTQVYVRTVFAEMSRPDSAFPTWHHVAGRLTRINRARYEGWHPGHALYIVAPVGEPPPERLIKIPISEDDLR